MIEVHRLNGKEFYLNSNHIETLEETPDTIVLLTNEKRYVVKESIAEILEKIVEFKGKIVKKSQEIE